jgi:hypothetical protein
MKVPCLVLLLTGCAADGTSMLLVDKEVSPMSRMQVITAINECESSNTRAMVITTNRKVNGHMIPSVVEVTCIPKFTSHLK